MDFSVLVLSSFGAKIKGVRFEEALGEFDGLPSFCCHFPLRFLLPQN